MPRSLAPNHWVKDTTLAGAPKPWNQPLTAQSTTASSMRVLLPMTRFRTAEMARPVGMKVRTLTRSDKKPLKTFPAP